MNILEADGEKLLTAVRDLLAAKGVVSNAEISERIAITDAANPGQGARMVAKAWTDSAYRALMLADGAKAAEERSIFALSSSICFSMKVDRPALARKRMS